MMIRTPTTLNTTPIKTPNCPAARCASGGGKSPLAKKIPDAHAQMKRRGEHTNHEKREIPRIWQIIGDRCVGGTAVGDPALGVKVPADINEGHEPGPTLQGVEPVAHPRILRNVRLAAQPDINAVTAVIQNGQKNKHPFHKNSVRNGLQILGSLIVFLRADQGRAVGPEMLGQKCANGNNSGKRMQLAKKVA